MRPDLQSGGFNHSPNYPYNIKKRYYLRGIPILHLSRLLLFKAITILKDYRLNLRFHPAYLYIVLAQLLIYIINNIFIYIIIYYYNSILVRQQKKLNFSTLLYHKNQEMGK